MDVNGDYEVRVGEEGLFFSAAHFITYGGTECECLHGHNYRVRAALSGPLNEDAYVYDFVKLEEQLAALADELDHRLLLPDSNPDFTVRRDGETVEVGVRGRRYRFPSRDVVHLPVRNTTAEQLAAYLADRLEAELAETGARDALSELEVEVQESPGQSAVHRRTLTNR